MEGCSFVNKPALALALKWSLNHLLEGTLLRKASIFIHKLLDIFEDFIAGQRRIFFFFLCVYWKAGEKPINSYDPTSEGSEGSVLLEQ